MYGLCMWGYMCMRVWMYAFAYMHVEVEEDIKYFSLLWSCCLDTGSLTNLKFTILASWSPRKFLESTCLYFWMLRLQASTVMSVFLHKYWGFEVNLLCFQNKHSYLLNHLPIS